MQVHVPYKVSDWLEFIRTWDLPFLKWAIPGPPQNFIYFNESHFYVVSMQFINVAAGTNITIYVILVPGSGDEC